MVHSGAFLYYLRLSHEVKYDSPVGPLHFNQLLLLQPFYGSLDFVWDNLGEPVPARNIHPLTPILVIDRPLSDSSIYYDPWHPPCSIYVPDSLFAQPLSKSSLVYLLVWHPPLHTPYIFSPSHCLLFIAHAHTITTSTDSHRVVIRVHIPVYSSIRSGI